MAQSRICKRAILDFSPREHFFNNITKSAVIGFSFAGQAQNNGLGFVGLKDWSERPDDNQSVFAIFGQAMGALSQVKDAMAFENGKPNGVQKRYYESGKLMGEITYKNGKAISGYMFEENGRKAKMTASNIAELNTHP